MNKTDKVRYRIGFAILLLLTVSSFVLFGVVQFLRYWNAEPLFNLDRPLFLNDQDDLQCSIRLKNLGDYAITIRDVRLLGNSIIWGPEAWSLVAKQEDTNNLSTANKPLTRLKPNSKSAWDVVLQLSLAGQHNEPNQPTEIVIIYQYGWFRRNVVLSIKTELPCS